MIPIKLILLILTLAPLKSISSHLHWDEIYDGGCIDEDKLPTPELNLFWVLQSMWSGWFIPLSSRSFLYPYCHFLKDEGCLSDAEMTGMCLRLGSEDVGMSFKLKNTGFGKEFQLNCSMEGESQVCRGDKVNIHGHTLKHYAKMYVTYTDNELMALTVKCQKHQSGRGRRAWSLMTTKPTISEKQRNMVLEHVESLGFDRSKTIKMDYSTCQKAK